MLYFNSTNGYYKKIFVFFVIWKWFRAVRRHRDEKGNPGENPGQYPLL